MRIRTKWHNKDKQKSIEEIAGVFAFSAWKMASTTVNRMYSEGFNLKSQSQLIDVVAEFLAFILQAADRMAYRRLAEAERERFVRALAAKLIETLVENRQDQQGPGEYRAPFVALLNERLGAYAEFSYSDDDPGFPLLRYFGTCVDGVMGGSDNKWVVEHVAEVEAPALLKGLRKAMSDLLQPPEQPSEPGEVKE